jgi:outer membrane protein assembly factor BamB
VVCFRRGSAGSGTGNVRQQGFGFQFTHARRVRAVFCLACWVPALVCASAQTGDIPGPAVIINGLSLPSAIASDKQGNLYVVDEGCGVPGGQGDCNVYRESASGGTWTQSRIAAFTSSNLPTSVAVDGSGNVYIGVTGAGIYRETPSGSGYTQTSVGCAFAKPAALASDSHGNLFVADSTTGRVYREKAADTCASATVVTNTASVTGLAVDECGDLYIAQSSGDNGILKEAPSGGGYAQSAVGSGMAGVIGVAVDGHRDVYYSDDAGTVAVWIPNAQGYAQQSVKTGLPPSPIGGMAVDGANNLYFAEFPSSRIWKAVPAFTPPPAPACGTEATAPPK